MDNGEWTQVAEDGEDDGEIERDPGGKGVQWPGKATPARRSVGVDDRGRRHECQEW